MAVSKVNIETAPLIMSIKKKKIKNPPTSLPLHLLCPLEQAPSPQLEQEMLLSVDKALVARSGRQSPGLLEEPYFPEMTPNK